MKLTQKQETIFEWHIELDTFVEIQEKKRKLILKKFANLQTSQKMMRRNAIFVKSLCDEIIVIDGKIDQCCKTINFLGKLL